MEVDIEVKKLAIYVHIPFCKQKCHYCGFNSFPIGNEEKIHRYITSLCKQIRYYGDKCKEFEVSSVYFGGGTPSFIDEKYIEVVMNTIKKHYYLLENAEITIEANPGTIDFNKLEKYRKLGFNRISFGVQTLNDNILKSIGRVHSAKEAEDGFALARKAGFDNVSLDIMIGLPNQTFEDVKQTVNSFIKFNPEHISAYSLKIEDNTVFSRLQEQGKLKLPSDEEEREMYYYIKDELKKSGYTHYEISNFSKPGYESRHNSAYWERQDYLGFGLSASSCFNEVRFTNTDDFESYVSKPIENFWEEEYLSDEVINSEKIILGLRMLKGIDENLFFKSEWRESLNKLTQKGLVKNNSGKISLTDRGLDLANQVFVEFI